MRRRAPQRAPLPRAVAVTPQPRSPPSPHPTHALTRRSLCSAAASHTAAFPTLLAEPPFPTTSTTMRFSAATVALVATLFAASAIASPIAGECCPPGAAVVAGWCSTAGPVGVEPVVAIEGVPGARGRRRRWSSSSHGARCHAGLWSSSACMRPRVARLVTAMSPRNDVARRTRPSSSPSHGGRCRRGRHPPPWTVGTMDGDVGVVVRGAASSSSRPTDATAGRRRRWSFAPCIHPTDHRLHLLTLRRPQSTPSRSRPAGAVSRR
ncbi:hypothetical protein FA09DRAFT_112583 [Tilletiopsis washingtonensis]|uniref:Uncharacterized protein n=1 Tax=Tilletiopsis washingtonensis TaxID=58919 RepID=A0A316ZK51_9BASI|nr:hypothetical protein FA09DRAFT_112583 [Tilletiopsis washingtonensis]PWO00746.1 hypothetical protein FA09DRAFT_112583 [Tilletiopsis washingtonensis]